MPKKIENVKRYKNGAIAYPKDAKPKAETQKRDCMTCGKKFESWGAGNRMCNDCRGKGDGSIYARYGV